MNPLAARAWSSRSGGMFVTGVTLVELEHVLVAVLGVDRRTSADPRKPRWLSMSIGISDEHVELADSLRKWAASLDGPALVRAAEQDAAAAFGEVWGAVGDLGVATIGLP